MFRFVLVKRSMNWVFPLFMMMAGVLAVTFIHYKPKAQGWIQVVSTDQTKNAFVFSSHRSRAIARYDEKRNAALVYLSDASQSEAYRKAGFLMLNPKGIPLCTQQ